MDTFKTSGRILIKQPIIKDGETYKYEDWYFEIKRGIMEYLKKGDVVDNTKVKIYKDVTNHLIKEEPKIKNDVVKVKIEYPETLKNIEDNRYTLMIHLYIIDKKGVGREQDLFFDRLYIDKNDKEN